METSSLVDEGLNKFDDDKEAIAAKTYSTRVYTIEEALKTLTAEAAPARNRFKTDGTGLKSEVLFNMMNDFLAEYQGARVLEEIDATFAFEIIPKKGEWPIAVYDVDFKNDVGHVKFG